jgi:hypothetical protein
MSLGTSECTLPSLWLPLISPERSGSGGANSDIPILTAPEVQPCLPEKGDNHEELSCCRLYGERQRRWDDKLNWWISCAPLCLCVGQPAWKWKADSVTAAAARRPWIIRQSWLTSATSSRHSPAMLPSWLIFWRCLVRISSVTPTILTNIILPNDTLTHYSRSGYYIYTTCFNKLELCILSTECICVFLMVLTINSDCFPKQH